MKFPVIGVGYLLGRLTDGNERDKGRLMHAIQSNHRAVCGQAPGPRSVGWQFEHAVVTCPRCSARLTARLQP
jgi:hypothetical protein